MIVNFFEKITAKERRSEGAKGREVKSIQNQIDIPSRTFASSLLRGNLHQTLPIATKLG